MERERVRKRAGEREGEREGRLYCMTCWSVTLTSCAHSLLKCPSVLHSESVFFVGRVSLTGWSFSNNVTTTRLTHSYNTLPLIDLPSFYKVTAFLLSGSKWLRRGNTINIRVQIFECHLAWRAPDGWWRCGAAFITHTSQISRRAICKRWCNSTASIKLSDISSTLPHPLSSELLVVLL